MIKLCDNASVFSDLYHYFILPQQWAIDNLRLPVRDTIGVGHALTFISAHRSRTLVIPFSLVGGGGTYAKGDENVRSKAV